MRKSLIVILGFAFFAGVAKADSYGKEQGILGPVTFGPVVGIGVPAPIQLGVEGKFMNIVGISFTYGFLPAISYEDVSMSTNGWNIAGRWFVFGRALFIGVAFGKQSFTGSQTDTSFTPDLTVSATYSQTFLAPHIGWRWQWESGMFVGMELGAQIPLSFDNSTEISDPVLAGNPTVQQMVARSEAQADKYGSSPLPWIGLLQFGYYF